MMYTNTLIYCLHQRVYMAKLYWRVKVDGKWTWKSAGTILEYHRDKHDTTVIMKNDGYNPGDSDE